VSELVLVATDGGRTAVSALRFAAAYSAERGATVEVISVVEPLSDLPMPLPHREELEHAHARGVAERVRENVRDVVGPVGWPVHVRLGRPAPAICEAARVRDASLLILGLDPKRGDGNGTAAELLHLAEKPVYVARDASLPRIAIVGVDFRPSSLRAAREAFRLIGPEGALHLVHVKPLLDFPAALVWDWGDCYECAVEDGFRRMKAMLGEDGVVNMHTHTRDGEPVAELMRLAEELEADMLAIGSDGYICHGRVVVGRVARRLIAESALPILATPVLTFSEGSITHLSAAPAALTPLLHDPSA
jgi:nucleotide-binding universal stress UspA family protein